MNILARPPLVTVYCQNPLCPYLMKKGRKWIVGRISERGELRCSSCRQVAMYEV